MQITYFSKALPLVSRVAAFVDELHLLENSRLARFSRTQQQHFNFISQVHFVPLQLVLNLLIPRFALL